MIQKFRNPDIVKENDPQKCASTESLAYADKLLAC